MARYTSMITITLADKIQIFIDVAEHALASKWYSHLEGSLGNKLVLEKDYCFLGYPDSHRNGTYICNEINRHISIINVFFGSRYNIPETYNIEEMFPANGRYTEEEPNQGPLNRLHMYFEELQGTSENISSMYTDADNVTKNSIRKLNLLCHELESWILSYRKSINRPEWMRFSQLMCWINAQHFQLEPSDYEHFGLDALCKETGGVYMGINKSIGKSHYEVFCDENGKIDDLTTTALRPQYVGSGDFDIEWAKTIAPTDNFKAKEMQEFKDWLVNIGCDPYDKLLGIGHPKVAQVNLHKSFGTCDHLEIYDLMKSTLDVTCIQTDNTLVHYKNGIV
jgi:hypothetical protein